MFGHQNDDQQPNDANHDTNQMVNDVTPPAPTFTPPQSDSGFGNPSSFSPPADSPTNNQDTGQNSVPAQPDDSSAPAPAAPNTNDLLDIKQQALTQLSPLVGHLDQTPEEKFRTTMMMIQASDNQSLIKDAFQAAQNISDEKVKAQALLDVINEINYFTHQTEN